jgi:hypothetical protein
MTTASSWLMTEGSLGNYGRGSYSRDIVGDQPYGVVTGTERRDVSEQLDLLALADTPLVNKIGWGPESGGTSIEWIAEDLGPGKVPILSTIACEWTSFLTNSIDGLSASNVIYQIQQGSVLYVYASTYANHCLAVVTSCPAMGGLSVSVVMSMITVGHGAAMMSVPGSLVGEADVFYVVGAFANEGSMPGRPAPRQRVVTSNYFTILRKDVQITGTMKSTDMYAIGREDRHQMMMRLKEMQRERERAALYSARIAKTSAMAGLMDGCLGFLAGQTGTHIDTATYGITETAVNNIVSFIWENGGRNLSFFGHINQTAKFTRWDKNRIRTRVNEGRGGGHITSYLTESGIEIDLIPMGNVPTNIAFVLDTSKIKLRAKRGRKAIMEKLGKMGDFDDWQILSEFSMEMKGYDLRQHGGFFALT